MPPVHLTAGIDERRRSFDELSLSIMRELLYILLYGVVEKSPTFEP